MSPNIAPASAKISHGSRTMRGITALAVVFLVARPVIDMDTVDPVAAIAFMSALLVAPALTIGSTLLYRRHRVSSARPRRCWSPTSYIAPTQAWPRCTP